MLIPRILQRPFLLLGTAHRTIQEQRALVALDEKLRTILPPAYASYESVQPVSMGSAALKYDADGQVAWDQIWGSFCHLAMAGGPPHKGKLLEPASPAEVLADPHNHQNAVNEISRGIRMVAPHLTVQSSAHPGCVRIGCPTALMASWLARAIVMENVSAWFHGTAIDLPAGPHFRIHKEVKNVVTAVAKTCHYFDGHIGRYQRRQMESIFAQSARRWPLLQPLAACDPHATDAWKTTAATKAQSATGLTTAGIHYTGWLGFEAHTVPAAIWMMRALVVSNVMARREDTVLYLPVNPIADPGANVMVGALQEVHRLAKARGATLRQCSPS